MTGEMTRDGARAGGRARRMIAASLVFTMLTSAVTVQAQVGSLTLPDTPLIPRPVKPTVMFTFDNSHTMNYPWVSNLLHPRVSNFQEAPILPWPAPNGVTVWGQASGLVIANDPSVYSSSVNLLYYNPAVRYLPGLDPDGRPMPTAGDPNHSPALMPNEPYRQMMGTANGPDRLSTNLTAFCIPNRNTTTFGFGRPVIALTALSHTRGTRRPTSGGEGQFSGTQPNAAPSPPLGSLYGHFARVDAEGWQRGRWDDVFSGPQREMGTYCAWNEGTDRARGIVQDNGEPAAAMIAFYYRYDPGRELCQSARDASGNPLPEAMKLRHRECFSREDILHPKLRGSTSDLALYGGGPDRTDCNATPGNPNQRSCTYEQEIRNFANWWAYHRTRSLAMKTAIGRALHQLPVDASFRVGLNWLNDYDGISGSNVFNEAVRETGDLRRWIEPRDWSVDQRRRFLRSLYAAGDGLRQTYAGEKEMVRAAVKVGEFLARGAGGANSCSGGMHVILSDGARVDPRPQVLRDLDSNLPYAGPADGDYDREIDNPNPDVNRSIGAVDVRGKRGALSDAAMFFYSKQLSNPDAGTSDPFASFRRVQTSVIGVGFEGFKSPVPRAGETSFLKRIAEGTDWWDPLDVPSFSGEEDARRNALIAYSWKPTIDDYWHAAINGRGVYHNAPTSDLTAWSRVLPSVLSATQSAQSLSKSGSTITQLDVTGAVFAYAATYSPGVWSGDVMRRRVNTLRGDDFASTDPYVAGSNRYSPDWSAARLLDEQSAGDGWSRNRRIFTSAVRGDGGLPANRAHPFVWASLGSAQQDRIVASARWNDWPRDRKDKFGDSTAAMGQAVVEFLRGKREDEAARDGRRVFRNRTSVLGSIVNSAVAYVGPPAGQSTDPGYVDFKESWQSRGGMIYVGANDGLLHAFDAVTGREQWAFMPFAAFQNHDRDGRDSGVGSQSIAEAGPLTYRPYAYVDSTPVAADVDTACAGIPCPATSAGGPAPAWRTILAGSLGKGGRSVYALDITRGNLDGDLPEDKLAQSRFLWEFTDSRMGFSFGEPIVAKTARWGWVVMIPSGYNNADGIGYIFVLNAKTGERIATLTTGEGSAAAPIGLAKIAGYSSRLVNQEVDSIYGGDLQGNVWRWDLAASSGGPDAVGVKIATLRDPGGKPQPVTIRPRVEVDDQGQRHVFVGTGKLLEEADIGKTDIQTMYAIRDGDRYSPGLSAAMTRDGLGNFASTDVTGPSPRKAAGWFMDLPRGEQVVVEPRFAFGAIFFAGTNTHLADPCAGGARTTLYGRSAAEARSVLVEKVSATSSGTVTASVSLATGASRIDAVLVRGAPSLRVTDSRGVGQQVRVTPNLNTSNRGRVGWREVADD